jgi:hypothetical protein
MVSARFGRLASEGTAVLRVLNRRNQLRRMAITAMTIDARPSASAAMNQFVRISGRV